ncbi:hypothetical protein [Bacillus carboniphilus]|uniref:hypothetical protein n=1 Tax=Bacillus carboniphilus TaxID=86663 RepID=UPI0031D839E1
MKNFFWKGFLLSLFLSLGLYLVWFQVSQFRFEMKALNWVHIIPSGVFNAFTEIFTPSIPDFLFVLPLVLTDAIIRGILSVVYCYFLLRKKDTISSWLTLILFIGIYQMFIHFMMPPMKF